MGDCDLFTGKARSPEKTRVYMTETRKRIILFATAILLVIGTVVGIVAIVQTAFGKKGPSKESIAEYERELSKLVYEKQSLTRQIGEIEDNIFGTIGKGAYMSFMFLNLDEELYDVVYPILNEGEYPLVGVLAFSADEMPGMYGKITMEQYGELLDAGWGTVLYWNGEGSLDTFIMEMRAMLTSADIDVPVSIAFKGGSYDKNYDSLLEDNGIVNVIHNGDGSMNILNVETPDGLWYPGYIGWNNRNKYKGSVRLKDATESSGGYALFAIKFYELENDDLRGTGYYPIGEDADNTTEAQSFLRMIERFKNSIATSSIKITTVEGAREGRLEYEQLYGEMTAAGYEYKHQIEEQIKEVERQMTLLYSKYYGTEEK